MTSPRHRVKLFEVQHTTLIDAAALSRMLGAPGVVLVDCRFDLGAPAAGRAAYETAHIPGAVHADLNLDLSAPPAPGTGRHPLPARAAGAATMGRLGIDAGSQVIAYDASDGAFAARLWWLLRWLGHPAAAVLDGGFAAWVAHGGASQSGAVHARPRVYVPRAALEEPVASAQIEARLGKPGWLLIDARAAERYAGRSEPLDRVAGHVPGAVNFPYRDSLSKDGRFLPAPELRRSWQRFLGDTPATEVVCMCGSGVTACHNLLSLAAAGLDGARLYAGSWSEWISDPKRPVARGSDP